MPRYQVIATADLCFEIDAENSEQAANVIAEAFKLSVPYDPLANITVWLDKEKRFPVELKTTTIQEWSVPEIETREAD